MSGPTIIVNADCLLVERLGEDVCNIYRPNFNGVGTDIAAFAIRVGGKILSSSQFVSHFQFMEVHSFDVSLLSDICDTLFVKSLAVAYVLTDGEGYVFHGLQKNNEGLWEYHTTKGGPNSAMVVGKDGSVLLTEYIPVSQDGLAETVQIYTDLSQQGTPLSGFFDVYIGKRDEINKNMFT